jgi:hypothetical protein
MTCSTPNRLNRAFRASWISIALALVLDGLAPLAGHAGEPRREIVFIDDFIRDRTLRSGDWAVNGPAVASTLTSLPGAQAATLAPPTLGFDSRSGLSLAAAARPGEQSGVQTHFAYTPPFRLTAAGTAAPAGPGALEIALATADASAGVAIVGGDGLASQATGLAMVAATGSGKPWRARQDHAWLSRDAPVAGKPYEFIIDVDEEGLARVYVRSAGQVLGADQIQVGSGPFYVVLGQASGANAAGQPNLAHWKGVTISRPPR